MNVIRFDFENGYFVRLSSGYKGMHVGPFDTEAEADEYLGEIKPRHPEAHVHKGFIRE